VIITIDGPTASGKSTVAKALARVLGFYYLNTGMLYRALAYVLLNYCHYTVDQLHNPDLKDLVNCLDTDKLIYCYNPDGSILISYQGIDITPFLKTSEMDQAASIVSSNYGVREQLLEFQRRFAKIHNIVAEGRDMGTVVFPLAEKKFFLTASIEERGRRWQHDRALQDEKFNLAESMANIHTRDSRDEQRACAPLKIPQDSIIIDSTHKSIDEVVKYLVHLVKMPLI